ncbi:MAG TPA: long-chain fatty acid--CoA ligase [Syntrophus sp. (in: bacteria)]|nr:long-chain fatty acid--CoA ligase [Syntrophus sp. (in: bacteria)]
MEERIWHKAYVAGVSPTLDIERITLYEILARTAARYPEQVALIMMGTEITYRQLHADVDRFAGALAGLGIRKGDKVALILANMPQMVIATYALFRLGAVAVMNNPLYTETELEHNLRQSEARMAVCLDFLAPRVLSLKDRTRLEAVVACHIREYLPDPGNDPFVQELYALHMDVPPQEGVYEFRALLEGGGTPPETRVAFDDPAAFIFTGGTTGVSKAVVISHANSSTVVQQFKEWIFDAEDGTERLLAVLPFFHVAGYTDIMNNAIYRGWTAVLVPRPTPDVIIELTLKYRPGLFGGVPTMFVGLLNNPKFKSAKLDFIKGCLSGAAPVALETIRAWEEATGSTIVELYGLTETSALATFNPWRGKTKLGSVGVPVPETDCRIVDLDTGTRDLKLGETGEILIKGPQVTRGYYNDPEATASIRDGWLATGDIGYLDDEGYLFIVDRKKDVIIAGGYNIYPREVDEILYEHPKVQAACVVGIPDAYRGETVKAFVVLKAGQTATEAEIVAFCREKLAAYKVPKSVEFRTELPQTSVGKILRRGLRDEEITRQKGA